MLRGLDHIVILVRDLAQASADYAQLGFTVTPGGEHVGLGTHNALITFGDGAYFELIAFKEPDRPHDMRWWSRLVQGEGLIDYCLFGDGLEAEAAAIRSRGLVLHGPIEMSRRRPDGQEITWRLVVTTEPIGQTVLPFMIEDTTPRSLRVPGDAASVHPLGVAGVEGLILATRDVAVSARALATCLGSEGRPVSASTESGGKAQRWQVGSHWLEIVEPAGTDDPVAQHLNGLGEGPYEVRLRRAGGGAPARLDLALTHGARIRLE